MSNDLWPPVSHSDDPRTSKDAEKEATNSGRRVTHADEVLSMVRRCPGSTATELASKLSGLTLTEVRRRLTDLRHRGRVVRGQRRGREMEWVIPRDPEEPQRELFRE